MPRHSTCSSSYRCTISKCQVISPLASRWRTTAMHWRRVESHIAVGTGTATEERVVPSHIALVAAVAAEEDRRRSTFRRATMLLPTLLPVGSCHRSETEARC